MPMFSANFIGSVVNVKTDFSAVGDGIADDTAAIQAAVDWTIGNRGIIFFPPGTYKIISPILFGTNLGSNSIIVIGSGAASTIAGSFAGYLFDRSIDDGGGGPGPLSGVRSIEWLRFTQGSAAAGSGCVRWGNCVGSAIVQCDFNGGKFGLNLSDETGNSSQSMVVDTCTFSPAGAAGTIGLMTSANTSVRQCDFSGFQRAAIRAYGVCLTVEGGRYEVNGTVFELGLKEDGTNRSLDSFVIEGSSLESNIVGVDTVGGCGRGKIANMKIHGFEGSGPYNINHGAFGSRSFTSGVDPASPTGSAAFTASISAAGVMTVTAVSSGTIIPGPLDAGDFVAASGVPTGNLVSGQLTQTNGDGPGLRGTYQLKSSPEYCIRLRGDDASGVKVECNSTGGQMKVANICIENSTNRGGIVVEGNGGAVNSSRLGGVGWQVPTRAHTAHFVNGTNDVQPTYLFANLTATADTTTLYIGETYYITDGNQATVGGNVTAGGGSNKSWVTWDGSNWKRGV